MCESSDGEKPKSLFFSETDPEKMSVEQLQGEVLLLRQLLVNADFVARARYEYDGLCDDIDNSGRPYRSQWSTDLIERAKTTANPQADLLHWRG